ncbi:AzlC family ABC transporter permease [Bifidobacterium sp. ESL0790]|uniref:AzlC family ABC transporter permease n=1 Tax=Bifidobacterium sp. ESL0790 TaxID=2983233 RepID=UPI0023F68758|nr:AzlC family ABC transporter permease [Bifidobacterium sp. ESL0790]WEV73003.1 AzlC family ABC transporter permease [Bifidobacterium sp. ESL0790]
MAAGKGMRLKALKFVFPKTLPICVSFMFTAMSYGLLMYSKGFPFIYPALMAASIFAGSMEFVLVDLLVSAFNPFAAFILTLMVNGRHFFYGLSMLGPYRNMGWKKPFLIFWMCDETFAINSSMKVPKDIDRGWAYLWVSMFDYSYWVTGAMLGWLIGGILPFSTKGVGFAMVAMFVSILLDQWKASPHTFRGHIPVLVGLATSVIALAIFGPQRFMLPALVAMLVIFELLRPYLEKPHDEGSLDGTDTGNSTDIGMSESTNSADSTDKTGNTDSTKNPGNTDNSTNPDNKETTTETATTKEVVR